MTTLKKPVRTNSPSLSIVAPDKVNRVKEALQRAAAGCAGLATALVNPFTLGAILGLQILVSATGQSDVPVCVPEFAEPLPDVQLASVTLCFTGDNLLGARMPGLVEKHGEDWPYSAVIDVLQSADVTFGNLECPITDHAVRTPRQVLGKHPGRPELHL